MFDIGQIRLSGQYNKMRRVGIWKHYDSTGNLIFEENYSLQDNKENDQLDLLAI